MTSELTSQQETSELTDEERKTLSSLLSEPTKEDLESLITTIEAKREDIRSKLAERLMWLLIGTYISIAISMVLITWIPSDSNQTKAERYAFSKDIFTLMLTTQVGIFGAVIGFYFGSSAKDKK